LLSLLTNLSGYIYRHIQLILMGNISLFCNEEKLSLFETHTVVFTNVITNILRQHSNPQKAI